MRFQNWKPNRSHLLLTVTFGRIKQYRFSPICTRLNKKRKYCNCRIIIRLSPFGCRENKGKMCFWSVTAALASTLLVTSFWLHIQKLVFHFPSKFIQINLVELTDLLRLHLTDWRDRFAFEPNQKTKPLQSGVVHEREF